MKEFEGHKLSDYSNKKRFYLVFHCGEELSQDVSFDTEKECDEVLNNALEGKGIKVKYDFERNGVIVFPHTIRKFTQVGEWTLSDESVDELRGRKLTLDVKFPEHIGHNKYQPKLLV